MQQGKAEVIEKRTNTKTSEGEIEVEGAEKGVDCEREEDRRSRAPLLNAKVHNEARECMTTDKNMVVSVGIKALNSNDDKLRNLHIRQSHPDILPRN